MLLYTLDRLGKGIVLRELIAFHGCLICVFMPLIGYRVYNYDNFLARMWLRYMPIKEPVYFSFALPAMIAFTIAICWPLNRKEISDSGEGLKEKLAAIRAKLIEIPNMGLYLSITGVLMFSIINIIPDSLRYIAVLIYLASFAGFLYIYYTQNFRFRVPLLILFVVFIISDAIRGGMFTIVAYMGITLISFFFINRNVAFWKKISVFVLGSAILLLVQSVKSTYRKQTWKGNYSGSKAELFGELLSKKITSSTALFSEEAFFPIHYRVNQGFNVALVMRRIPELQDYDHGYMLSLSFASAVVPRFLWPDKPEAGGKFNMKYYAGVALRGWSTNVGPLGEAYGSFGSTGGIVFMFFLGALIRLFYKGVFKIANKVPLILFWIPVLFYQVTYSLETDTLQILNSLFKASFLIWLLYKFVPKLFGVIKVEKQKHYAPYQTTSQTP
jgi:hypothetical protein